MPPQAHHIGRLTLEVRTPGLDSALQLRARAEDIAWKLLPQVIGKVLDALAPADLQLRIDRLELDLGDIAAGALEQDAPLALERCLTEALAQAVATALHTPGADARALSPSAALLEDFDTYLTQGTVPFRPAAHALDPAASIERLIAEQPTALAGLLHRRAHDRQAIERLVLQAGEAGLRALLGLLAPADAAVILDYLGELRRLHPQMSPSPLADASLCRVLWTVTLGYLLREAGTQFNRRSFLGALLQGLARAERLAYPELLALLHAALAGTCGRPAPAGSLLGILDEWLDAPAPGLSGPGSDRPAAVDAFAAAEAGELEPLLSLLHRASGDPTALDALVRRMTGMVFAGVVRRLEPVQAELILAYLADLGTLHHHQPQLAWTEAAYERQLRQLVLRYLLRDAGSQFNRVSWLRRLLHELAAEAGVGYVFLLGSLADALRRLRQHLPQSSSLPLALVSLAAELAPGERAGWPDHADEGAAPVETGHGRLDALLLRLRRHADDPPALAALVHGLATADFEALVERMQPGHADRILADLADLTRAQRQEGLWNLADSCFERQLRLEALRTLLALPDRAFGRTSWLQQLLQGLTQAAPTDPTRLLEALLASHRHFPPGSDLPLALAGVHTSPEDAAAPSIAADTTIAMAGRHVPTLARELVRAEPPRRLALLRWLAGDPGLLSRVVDAMDERGLAALLAELDHVHAAGVLEDLRCLRARHRIEPTLPLAPAEFDRLTWTQALAALACPGDRPFSRDRTRQDLLAGLARHQGLAARELGSWQSLMEHPPAAAAVDDRPPTPPGTMLLAERFLGSGQPQDMGPRLGELADGDPVGFAALLRRLLAAASGKSETLIERLLDWMLPEEIVATLLPGQADRAWRWAEMLADRPGASMAAAWRQVLDAALREQALDTPEAPGWPARRLDHPALLRAWLDTGSLPWWAPPDTRLDTLLAGLPEQPLAVLHGLFGDAGPARTVSRLRRALSGLGPDAGSRLLQRLLPWAHPPGGPLSPDLDELRMQAAAAAIAGRPFDPGRLDHPLPPPPETPATVAPGRQPQDREILFAWLADEAAGAAMNPDTGFRLLADLLDRGDAGLDALLRDGLARSITRARWAEALPGEVLARLVHRMLPMRARFMLDLATVLEAAWRQAAPARQTGHGAIRSTLLAIVAEQAPPAPRSIATRLVNALLEGTAVPAERLLGQALWMARQGAYAHLTAVLGPQALVPRPSPPRPPAAAPQRSTRPVQPRSGCPIYVRNAGLVLFNPFLPRFFGHLGLLDKDHDGVERVLGIEAASRAVHLLQYLVDERCDTAEPELVLNKLLCGIATDAPVARSIDPDASGRAACEDMIGAVIGNWPIIGNTSAAGLRETFLQREGRLQHENERWTLTVQRRTVDVLVEQIPWNHSLVYHPWMAGPLYITW